MEPNDREVAKLERMADESGEIERETFTAYAKKSEAFKEYMEAERKSGIDKAEIAFKVSCKKCFLKLIPIIKNRQLTEIILATSQWQSLENWAQK